MDDWHIVNHIEKPLLRKSSVLHVVAVVSNPARWHSRYRITRRFIEEMAKTKHVKLHVVETAFGDRHHEIEDLCRSLDVDYLSLRTHSEIWIKENMINLGMRRVLVNHPEAEVFILV